MKRKFLCLILTLSLVITASVIPTSAAQTSYLRGDTDFNGKLTAADFLNMQYYLLGYGNLTGNYEQATDVDGNMLTNSTDALTMLQHMLGIKTVTGTFNLKFWSAVPMTSPSQNGAGVYGGEGCQWPVFITFSETDGNVAYMGTDVGGMYKSTDGGITWAQASIGIGASGVGCIKTDPKNANRVLVQGVNSSANGHNGLYLSTDGGKTYAPVKEVSIQGNRDFRDCIAYDASSYSSWRGYSSTVYWLQEDGTLYKSTNGGSSWSTLVTASTDYVKGHIFVHPTKGYVYIASSVGFFRSTNKGSSFTKIYSENFNGMDVISTQPDKIYLSSNNGIYVSADSGATVTKVDATGLPKYPTRIEVSPVNPNYMVVDNDMLANEKNYSNISYYSHDGGTTWTKSNRNTSNSVVPYNARNNVLSWSPTDANVCLSLGGDMILRSADACKNFTWSNSGYNGAAVTDIAYNVNNPALMTATNQDYAGFVSTDYGRTWKYMTALNLAGWGGYAYGSYPVSATTIVAFRNKDPQNLIYSTDGGKTAIDTGLTTAYKSNACVTGMKGDNKIVFANEFRSTNGGKTWTTMNGCVSVYGGNESKVFGVNANGKPVVSSDKGATWTVLNSSYSNGIKDMCYDELGNRLLFITNDNLNVGQFDCTTGAYKHIKYLGDIKDSFGEWLPARQIVVDPQNSDVYYIAVARQVCANEYGVIKVTNNSQTWTNITSTRNNIYYGDDGGRQVTELCINPATRHLFAGGGCRGIFKVALDQ
ncbi:MAG: hypothetical protein IJF58_02055 [Clostridia bacterium]|nr:hypothetical protein [Clostridia bacterium]